MEQFFSFANTVAVNISVYFSPLAKITADFFEQFTTFLFVFPLSAYVFTGNYDDLILVDGTDFPDGITINSLASKFKAPIMLTPPNKLSETTSSKINDWSIKNILIGGGYKSVSKSIEDNLGVEKKERVDGVDRYLK